MVKVTLVLNVLFVMDNKGKQGQLMLQYQKTAHLFFRIFVQPPHQNQQYPLALRHFYSSILSQKCGIILDNTIFLNLFFVAYGFSSGVSWVKGGNYVIYILVSCQS